jgi:hypothetical protein
MAARVINILAGLWLMIAPAALQLPRSAAVVLYICGPLIASVAMVSMSESVRNFRYTNLLFAVFLLAAPLVAEGGQDFVINNILVGLLVIACALKRGQVKNRFGGGWRSLLEKHPAHLKDRSQ